MILKKINKKFTTSSNDTFVSTSALLTLFEKKENFKKELLEIFELAPEDIEIFKVGNSESLINAIKELENQCEKIDIVQKWKNINLKKMLDEEKAIFEISSITNDFILTSNKSDILDVETRYSAKADLLDYYNFSRFANYCRDNQYEDLIDSIQTYLNNKNAENNETVSLRLLYKYDESKYYLRAITSVKDYKDYGINFSVFVALVALGRYIDESQDEIFISNFSVSESEIYVSFSLKNEIKLNDKLLLSIDLILENDEIKSNSVSFNGVCKLRYSENNKQSDIYIKPNGIKKEGGNTIDILTYPHRGSIDKVYQKIQELPAFIQEFIKQISEDAPKIASIQKPDDVKQFIAHKINNSRKKEFQNFKEKIFKMLMEMTVDNTFELFDLLRSVDELFDHNDIVSRDFWRTKLYEALIQRK